MANLRSLRVTFFGYAERERRAILDFHNKAEQCGYPTLKTGLWLRQKMGKSLGEEQGETVKRTLQPE